jgi:PKD repeat protein
MTPQALADLSATLTITSNSQYSATLNIPLHGTSLVRKLEIFPSSIDFGTVDLGKKAYRLVEFRNSGAGSIILSGIQIAGGDKDEFFQDITCTNIAEGQSCTDTVWYIPSFEGMKSSSLAVSSNDPFHPEQSVPLSGGTGPSLPLHVTIAADPEVGMAPLYINFSSLITGGQGPYWYRWDIEDIGSYTEQESVRILFPDPGIYTAILKVTDINNQTDADTILVAVSSAYAPVVLAGAEPVSGEIPLLVSFDAIVSGGNAPLTFFWNFRDGGTSNSLNPSHLYPNPGTYWARITVTDADGDQARDSVLITARWNTSFSGQLWDKDGIYPVNESVVRFIQRVNIMNRWTDILEGTNEYRFRNLDPGEYTVLVIPDTTEYPQYLPTYLGRKLTLNEATWVNMTGYVTGQDIRLIRKPVGSNGQGSFYGNVGIAYNPKGTNSGIKGTEEIYADDLSGIYVYLMNAGSGELIAYDITDEYGDFIIDGLENGSYVIIVDYKGLPMDPANTLLVISDEVKSAELNIVVHNDRISVINLTTGLEERLSGGLRIYPVPSGDHIMLAVPEGLFRDGPVRMSIISMSGTILTDWSMSEMTQGPIRVDISNLPEGLYVLKLTDNKVSCNLKIIRLKQ